MNTVCSTVQENRRLRNLKEGWHLAKHWWHDILPFAQRLYSNGSWLQEDFDDANPFLAKSNMTIIGLRTCQADYDPDIISNDMMCATGINVTTPSGVYHKDPCVVSTSCFISIARNFLVLCALYTSGAKLYNGLLR